MHLRIYIVEDNSHLRENLTGVLEALTSAKVVGTAATQDEAQAWLARHAAQWDVAVVDLFLRNGSGMELVQQLSVRHPAQKVVVFSNYVNAAIRKRCAQRGVDAVFDKSTQIDSLIDYCARLRGDPEGNVGG
jgi:DNA-binding NarL/FixJ family response regulator